MDAQKLYPLVDAPKIGSPQKEFEINNYKMMINNYKIILILYDIPNMIQYENKPSKNAK